MRQRRITILFLAGAAACDFDAAFKRYCEGNASCPRADAAAGPEASADLPAEASVPEASADLPAEVSVPDASPDLTEDASVVPDAPSDTPDSAWWREGPDGLMPFPPPPPKQCFRREDCGPKEICHPFGNVCMRECNSVEDCPKWLDTCAEITDPEGGSTRTPKVCKCGIAQNCNSYASNFTCNSWDDLCEWMCKEDIDCAFYEPGRTCDKPTGQCRGSVPACSSNRDCPAPTLPRCNLATSRCTGCVASSDCANRPDGFTACDSTGACYRP